jgi:hypothetical protein
MSDKMIIQRPLIVDVGIVNSSVSKTSNNKGEKRKKENPQQSKEKKSETEDLRHSITTVDQDSDPDAPVHKLDIIA